MLNCQKCSFDNPADMKFCGQCGTELAKKCLPCGFVNPSSYKFCGQCGVSLTRSSNASSTGTLAVSSIAERRQLTVMFCDLADSAALADKLDPEELRSLIIRYQHACTRHVTRFGGHVAQYLGDGILVYFGYPTAHEDDAHRAIYSGLGCLEAVAELNTELDLEASEQLIVRIGIHTGLVVTGEIGTGLTKEHLALGRTPTIAARLQSLAPSNSLIVSGDTYRLIAGFFETEPMGAQALKGIALPIEVYRVKQEGDAKDRFDVALRCGGLTPLVGRTFEIDQINKLWEKATQGQGQVALLKGEAGVGKSRLTRAFRDHLKNQRHSYLSTKGLAFAGASSFRPVIETLEKTFGFERHEAVSSRFQKLETTLKKHQMSLVDHAPLFASILGLPLPDDYQEVVMTPELRKRRTLEAVFQFIQHLSLEQPLLFVVEDLHWLDPSTLELLNMLVMQGPTQRIFVFFTCRPTFSSPWIARSNLTEFNLSQLNEIEVRAMVNRLTQDRGLPEEFVDAIVEKTDGVPLFVEELTKMVIESGLVKEVDGRYVIQGEFSSLNIPSTLQDSLTARLDGLGPAKEIAQLAAVIGREFSFDLLQAITDHQKSDLERHLAVLLDAELCFQRGVGSDKSYVFKHALIQETAMRSMLKSKRHHVHRKIATVIEHQHPEIARMRPEYVAQHYSDAGEYDTAINWWLRAGKHALSLSANLEAIDHLENGLKLLRTLTETDKNLQRDLQFQTALGPAYCATLGYAAPAVEKAYSRARELCRRLGETPELFPTLWGSWAYYVVRADLSAARDSANEMLRIAQSKENNALLLEAHMALGVTSYFLGRPQDALQHMELALAADSEHRDRSFTFVSGQDAGVCNLAFMGLTLWMLGRPEEALNRSREAVALARSLKHPFSLAYALNFASWLRFMLGQPDRAALLAEEEITIAGQQGFFWVTLGSIIVGWSQAQGVEVGAGLEKIRNGLAAYRGPGARLSETLQLAITAEVALKHGDALAAQACIDEALVASKQTSECFWLADLHRILGDISVHLEIDDAGQHYETALALAQQQGAIGLQQRIEASLARACSANESHASQGTSTLNVPVLVYQSHR